MKLYFCYILTNPSKTVLYIGVTNDVVRRVQEHFAERGDSRTFTGRYHCYRLLYVEEYTNRTDAIQREKVLKKYSRAKKEALIREVNPKWEFLM